MEWRLEEDPTKKEEELQLNCEEDPEKTEFQIAISHPLCFACHTARSWWQKFFLLRIHFGLLRWLAVSFVH
jgi:hypothetical protein